ncbi:hypothetical protein IAT38_004774 [Cryptococcus sp. DSM 104549]
MSSPLRPAYRHRSQSHISYMPKDEQPVERDPMSSPFHLSTGWRGGTQKKWFLVIEFGKDFVVQGRTRRDCEENDDGGSVFTVLQPTAHQQLIHLLPHLHLPSPLGLYFHLNIPAATPSPFLPKLTDTLWPTFFASFLISDSSAGNANHSFGGLPIAARLELRVDKAQARWWAGWKKDPDEGTVGRWVDLGRMRRDLGHDAVEEQEAAKWEANKHVEPVSPVRVSVRDVQGAERVQVPARDVEADTLPLVPAAASVVDEAQLPPPMAEAQPAASPKESNRPPPIEIPSTASTPLCLSSVAYSPVTSPPAEAALASQPFLQELNAALESAAASNTVKERRSPGLTIALPMAPWADLGSAQWSAATSWGPPDTPEGWDHENQTYVASTATTTAQASHPATPGAEADQGHHDNHGSWTFLPRGPVSPTPWNHGWPFHKLVHVPEPEHADKFPRNHHHHRRESDGSSAVSWSSASSDGGDQEVEVQREQQYIEEPPAVLDVGEQYEGRSFGLPREAHPSPKPPLPRALELVASGMSSEDEFEFDEGPFHDTHAVTSTSPASSDSSFGSSDAEMHFDMVHPGHALAPSTVNYAPEMPETPESAEAEQEFLAMMAPLQRMNAPGPHAMHARTPSTGTLLEVIEEGEDSPTKLGEEWKADEDEEEVLADEVGEEDVVDVKDMRARQFAAHEGIRWVVDGFGVGDDERIEVGDEMMGWGSDADEHHEAVVAPSVIVAQALEQGGIMPLGESETVAEELVQPQLPSEVPVELRANPPVKELEESPVKQLPDLYSDLPADRDVDSHVEHSVGRLAEVPASEEAAVQTHSVQQRLPITEDYQSTPKVVEQVREEAFVASPPLSPPRPRESQFIPSLPSPRARLSTQQLGDSPSGRPVSQASSGLDPRQSMRPTPPNFISFHSPSIREEEEAEEAREAEMSHDSKAKSHASIFRPKSLFRSRSTADRSRSSSSSAPPPSPIARPATLYTLSPGGGQESRASLASSVGSKAANRPLKRLSQSLGGFSEGPSAGCGLGALNALRETTTSMMDLRPYVEGKGYPRLEIYYPVKVRTIPVAVYKAQYPLLELYTPVLMVQKVSSSSYVEGKGYPHLEIYHPATARTQTYPTAIPVTEYKQRYPQLELNASAPLRLKGVKVMLVAYTYPDVLLYPAMSGAKTRTAPAEAVKGVSPKKRAISVLLVSTAYPDLTIYPMVPARSLAKTPSPETDAALRGIPVALVPVSYPSLVIYPAAASAASALLRSTATRVAIPLSNTESPTKLEAHVVPAVLLRTIPVLLRPTSYPALEIYPTVVPILLEAFEYPHIVIYPQTHVVEVVAETPPRRSAPRKTHQDLDLIDTKALPLSAPPVHHRHQSSASSIHSASTQALNTPTSPAFTTSTTSHSKRAAFGLGNTSSAIPPQKPAPTSALPPLPVNHTLKGDLPGMIVHGSPETPARSHSRSSSYDVGSSSERDALSPQSTETHTPSRARSSTLISERMKSLMDRAQKSPPLPPSGVNVRGIRSSTYGTMSPPQVDAAVSREKNPSREGTPQKTVGKLSSSVMGKWM